MFPGPCFLRVDAALWIQSCVLVLVCDVHLYVRTRCKRSTGVVLAITVGFFVVSLRGVTLARVRWIFIRLANPSDSLRLSFEYCKPKYCADVSREFDEFRVDTHLCKLHTKSVAHLGYLVCSINQTLI